MSDTETKQPVPLGSEEQTGGRQTSRPGSVVVRVVGAILVPIALVLGLGSTLDFLKDSDANRLLVALVAVVVGGAGVFLLFWAMDTVVDWFPRRIRESVRPYVFVGPALVVLAVFLVYPVLNTVLLSVKDAHSQDFVGLDNYKFLFSDRDMLRAMRNTAGWIILVPLVAVSIGLALATLTDRLRRGEAVAKSIIFLPMAISFAGASVTFRLIYDFRPEDFGSNIGLLNGVMLGLGKDPIAWLSVQPWNNLLLMVIMVWMQTGFAMVVLSAAIKSIPDEIIEAARIDGASELQVFRRIMIPTILPTIVVVTTYMIINALKIFDIVFVIGSPEANGTVVIAERMIDWFFRSGHDGRAAAIAVVLFVAVIPVMMWNIRRFREEESIR